MVRLPTIRLKLVFTTLIIALLWVTSPASAQTGVPQNHLSQLTLDELFIELKAAPGEIEANAITGHIWRHWTVPEEPALAILMTEALQARRAADFEHTMDLLNDLIAAYPEYAEGWNQRATIQFMLGNYQESLADIDETLEREPRHFGALSGQAMIHLRLGNQVKAIKSVVEALRYHPFLAEHGLFKQLLKPTTQT